MAEIISAVENLHGKQYLNRNSSYRLEHCVQRLEAGKHFIGCRWSYPSD